ncbi:MAG TPA: DUF1592 domain-containing protein [Gemmataceae bacterium]|nr:DUF1592 domain-containing protein [Gemmataceae bacterium]
MSRKIAIGVVLCVVLVGLAAWCARRPAAGPIAPDPSSDAPPLADALESRFASQVRPVLERHCFGCHGAQKRRGDLDLSRYTTTAAVAGGLGEWEKVLRRLKAEEMPPEGAAHRPTAEERAAVIAWIQDLRDREAQQSAGDPGSVLARRLSNAEYDYSVRDLTGVDIRPTREFPVDPADEAGFDNSGESLTMPPALLKKYLAAARLVADHVVLTPDGFVFAPFPAVTDTDRDHYCVQRIIDFYDRHKVDLADYFLAAWKYRRREHLGKPDVDLGHLAAEAGLSARYLAMIWSALNDADESGPLAAIRKVWRDLPDAGARPGCERLRDLVLRLRRQLKPKAAKLHVDGVSDGSQPFVLWADRQAAGQHCRYSGEVLGDLRNLADQLPNDAGLAKLFTTDELDRGAVARLRAGLESFCSVFPDAFVVSDRGPYFDPSAAGQGRPLTAGFHLMQGYFRDDGPLYDLILDDGQRCELDRLWDELDFITLAPMRQYHDFIFFERAEPPRFMHDAEFDFARSEDKDAASEAKMSRLEMVYLARARKLKAGDEALAAIESYFSDISARIRRVEQARLEAEPKQLDALVQFTQRAYRRPLSPGERDDILAFYQKVRRENDLSHEEALHDALVSVLMSPHFCYRIDLAEPGADVRPLSDYALASRLSYFLWSSMPDAELLSHAAGGDLHQPQVLAAQARRMLHDPRVRALATEFGGNWLDFRRFEEHNAVDRSRFPSFTNDLRSAMFEEPIRYFMDVAERNRSILDFVQGDDTFVNRVLARHYVMPEPQGNEWVHMEDAGRYGRGGLLPMAVFLTKNAPGLRTSPVKRGYWVVKRLLGEVIPPPPPTVPQLPTDEAKLGDLTLAQTLARHRADQSCAACHSHFDSIGLVFENYGPIGERRSKDLGGRPVETNATYPDGVERSGLAGLRQYLRDKRQDDFVENLCRKMFSYALGRSLQPSDEKAINAMKNRLTADGYAFDSLIEAIVTTPQFLNKRGRDDPREPH